MGGGCSKFAEAAGLGVADFLRVVVSGEVVLLRIAAIVDSAELLYAVKDAKNMLSENENFGVAFVPASAARSFAS